MKRPRVVLVAHTLEPGNGGIGRVARLTAKVLARRALEGSIEARAITLADPSPATDLGLPVWTAAGSRLRFVLNVQRAALTDTHMIYDSLGPARAHCRVPFFRKPFLAWIHGIEVWRDSAPDRLKRLRFKWAQRAAHLVSNSEYTRARSGLGRADLCWLATETDNAPSPSPSFDTPRVLLLGRVDELMKGRKELIASWPQVLLAIPDAVLTFVGGGPQVDALRQEAARSPASSRIEVLGFVPDGEMDQLWSRTTVFAMPSRVEGFGLVYIEAMRQGRPVIASIHDSGQEINTDGVTGFNVDLSNKRELAQRLIQLLSNRQMASAMGQQGRARWERYFRFNAFDARFSEILNAFLAQYA